MADAAYGCGAFAGLGHDMTMTTRARSTAVFCEPAPPRTGKRGRPRLKGRPDRHPHRHRRLRDLKTNAANKIIVDECAAQTTVAEVTTE